MKRCSRCGVMKQESAFAKRANRASGVVSRCRECARKERIARPACSFEGCEAASESRGLCPGHAQQSRKGKALSPLRPRRKHGEVLEACNFPGCRNLARSLATPVCTAHSRQQRVTGEMKQLRRGPGSAAPDCAFEECGRPAVSKGLCVSHSSQRLRGLELRPIRTNTGRRVNKYGYVDVKLPADHLEAKANGWALEHRAVMSDMIGRALLPEETVHHKNGERADNRPQNLELWTSRHPKGQRIEDVLQFAHEIIDLYG